MNASLPAFAFEPGKTSRTLVKWKEALAEGASRASPARTRRKGSFRCISLLLLDDLPAILGGRRVGVARRVGGGDLETVPADIQVAIALRRGAGLEGLRVDLALERARLVGAEPEQRRRALGLLRRILADRGLRRGLVSACPGAPATVA